MASASSVVVVVLVLVDTKHSCRVNAEGGRGFFSFPLPLPLPAEAMPELLFALEAAALCLSILRLITYSSGIKISIDQLLPHNMIDSRLNLYV